MKLFPFIFFFFTLVTQAQFQINGVVNDSTTNTPLSFTTIYTSSGGTTMSDVDGKFSLQSKEKILFFTVSYVGFITQKTNTDATKKFYLIALSPKKSNPLSKQLHDSAFAIIKKVIQNTTANNPEKKLKNFQFKAYNKLIVSANPDSINGRVDSIFKIRSREKRLSKIDSSDYKFKKIISKQHLFQIEKVSNYQYRNAKWKETILGAKMAGLKEPIYEVLAFNLQSFSIYSPRYELFQTKYISPITSNGLSDYDYKLLDTLSIESRKTFVIHFKNKKKKNAAGLEGLFYIDQDNFSVAKVILRIKGVLDITGKYEFTYSDKDKLWFPLTKGFKIVKGKNDDDIRILGGTIQFDADVTNFKKRKKVASDFTYLLSDTKYSEIKPSGSLSIKRPYIAIEMNESALNKDESFWKSYRKDSLDTRSIRTYAVLDSISGKRKIEKRIGFVRKVLSGFFPLGPIDLSLRYLLSYNNYEGFRIGNGGITNEKFSKKYRIEGYTVFGTRDGDFKYSFGAATRIGKTSTTWLGGSYMDDLRDLASNSFATDKRPFKIYDPRPLIFSTFYNYAGWRGYIETKIIPKTQSIWQLSYNRIEPKFNYTYNLNGKLYSAFNLATAMISIQWNPFSDFMQTPNGRIEVEKRFPKFAFQFTQTLPKVLQNDLTFGKIDIRGEYEKKYLNGQKTALLLQGGYAYGDVPLTHAYNTSPNNLNRDKLIQRITFAGKNNFETMYFNEFFSDKYIFFQIKHGFNRITLFNSVKPTFVLVNRMAWGNLNKPQRHIGIDYKTLEKGYFESGVELNNIFKILGVAGYYRYGPNQLPLFVDNISIKLSLLFDLGI